MVKVLSFDGENLLIDYLMKRWHLVMCPRLAPGLVECVRERLPRLAGTANAFVGGFEVNEAQMLCTLRPFIHHNHWAKLSVCDQSAAMAREFATLTI